MNLPLIGTVFFDTGLLPFRLQYYFDRGVTKFILISDKQIANCHGYPVDLIHSANGFINGQATSIVESDVIEAFVPSNDWYMLADLDEFHYYPGIKSFQDIARYAEAEGADWVASEFVDRVTKDGTIPDAIDPNIPLDEQFPMASDVTRALLRGGTGKTVMARCSPDKVGPGHHACDSTRRASFVCQTHHFKWSSKQVIPWIEHRDKVNHKFNFPYAHESSSFLDHYRTNGRLLIETPEWNTRTAERIGV